MAKKDLWGNEIEQPPKEDRWNIITRCLSNLYAAYYGHDTDVDAALDELMSAYNDWLD